MLHFFLQNWGTIVVCIFLAGIIAAVVTKMIKDKKHGRSSCCGNCRHCGGACSVCRHPAQNTDKKSL